jgi:nitronate monooxygenase
MCDVVLEFEPRVVSFHYGMPDATLLRRVKDAGLLVMSSATSVEEARWLEGHGCDAVIAQGNEAGGHRGMFLNDDISRQAGTMALVPQVVDAVRVPVIASGGIMDGRGIAAARVLGAQGVQLGTAFLGTEEAGIGPDYRRALAGPTTVTDVLTGRYARAARTPLVERLEASGVRPPDYPLPRYFLTGPPLLAGQGGRLTRSLPAAELVRALEQETTQALSELT